MRTMWLLILAGALSGAPQTTGAPAPSTLRYFALEGEVDRAELGELLAELSSAGGEHRIVAGPTNPVSRPSTSFLALEVPAGTSSKDLARSLKKTCKRVEQLAWTSFEGASKELPTILGQSPRDCVIGMASPMRWFEAEGDRKHFWYVAGELEGREIADRFAKLFGPFQAGEIGELRALEQRLVFEAGEDGKRLEKAAKALLKLEGVSAARVDGPAIVVEVVLDGLLSATRGGGADSPMPELDPAPMHAVLAEAGLQPLRG